jgi:uncharacterized membrane protein YjgN (DUF898 family)
MVVVGIAMAGVIAAVKLSGLQTPGQGTADLQKIFFSSGFLLGAVVYALGLTFITAYYKAAFLNASIGSVEIGPHKLYSRLSVWGLSGILLSNLLLMMVTLGLFYPWAKVRALRYQLTHTGVIAEGELNQFVAASEANPGATGEEISEFLDIDFGF